MLCKDLLETTLVDRCWNILEYGRIMKDILGGEGNLKLEIETGLRDIREVEEAEVAMLMEEAVVIRRQEKIERLRKDGLAEEAEAAGVREDDQGAVQAVLD